MANTNILIKRSTTTGRPSSLLAGEFAYSYSSNTLFFGSPTGNGVVNVGGVYYTQTLDAATTANTATTLVKRDANGAFAGRLTGIADKADILTNARNFSISGTDITASTQSFDGSSAIVLNAALNAVPGLTAGSVGSTTQIPVITYGANGRILGVTTAAISTSFTIAADSGASQTISGGDTLTLVGGSGITSTASATDTVTFDVDTTVVRANTPITLQTIDSNVTITGNLAVQGTQFVTNTTTLNIADPLIYLASNNYTSDLVDIGFAANYFDGTNERHTGVFRNAGNRQYYVFDNYLPEISGNNEIDVANTSFRLATLNANLIATIATVGDLTLTNALPVASGGTGKNTFTSGQLIIGSGTNGLTQIANSSVAVGQSFGSASVVPVFQTDVYGRVSSVSNTSIAIDASAITSGTLPIARGGTNGTAFTNNQITYFDGSKIASLANTTYTQTGTLASNNTITAITVDGFGRFTAATVGAISGLTVAQGGTGLSTITTNGITYGNGTGAVGVTAVAGGADQTWSNQILTVTNAGVPVWSSALDGGQF
jgi:hypothetical protein